MTDIVKTTIQLESSTKAKLDKIKNPKDSYSRALDKLLADNKQEDGWVVLRMTKEDYKILMNRQSWNLCEDILRDAKQ